MARASKNDSISPIKRRNFLMGSGGALMAAAVWPAGVQSFGIGKDVLGIDDATGGGVITQPLFNFNGIVADTSGFKPVYLPAEGIEDAATLSLAENLFWNDIMMEHSLLLTMFLPGPELKTYRDRAATFHKAFDQQLQHTRSAVAFHDFRNFNSATIQLVRELRDLKKDIQTAQEAGSIHTLGWPSFYNHIAGEAQHFIDRLEALSAGEVMLDRRPVVAFWADIMKEHAYFVAHFLDPVEKELIAKALNTADLWRQVEENIPDRTLTGDPVMALLEEMIDFKTAAELGIQAGTIKSMLLPSVADHVRREAIKFGNDLKRG